MDRATLARNILGMLQQRPDRYVTFGPYWPLVKALLLRYYSRENLLLLGDHVDAEAATHMPDHETLDEALQAAVEFHRAHAAYGFGRGTFEDERTGEVWVLRDPDAGGM